MGQSAVQYCGAAICNSDPPCEGLKAERPPPPPVVFVRTFGGLDLEIDIENFLLADTEVVAGVRAWTTPSAASSGPTTPRLAVVGDTPEATEELVYLAVSGGFFRAAETIELDADDDDDDVRVDENFFSVAAAVAAAGARGASGAWASPSGAYSSGRASPRLPVVEAYAEAAAELVGIERWSPQQQRPRGIVFDDDDDNDDDDDELEGEGARRRRRPSAPTTPKAPASGLLALLKDCTEADITEVGQERRRCKRCARGGA